MQTDLQAEFKLLLVIQSFFSSLNIGDIKILNGLANELFRLEKWFSDSKILTVDVVEMKEILRKLRQQLDVFDRHLPVASLRRHFEQVVTPDENTLDYLLRFYLSKQIKTVTDRDKVNLIVTRWGRCKNSHEEDNLTERPNLLEDLNSIYRDLGLRLTLFDREKEIISALKKERASLLQIKSLRELIDKQILLRVRKIKDEIEKDFFQPSVLVELVETNISLHNVFQKLLVAEQPRVALNNEVKSQVVLQQTLSINLDDSLLEKSDELQEELLGKLEIISQSLSSLALKVQVLAEKLQNQKNNLKDQK